MILRVKQKLQEAWLYIRNSRPWIMLLVIL